MSKQQTAHQRIMAAEIGAFTTLQKVLPTGSLQARRLRDGSISLYWRYTFAGRRDRHVIGRYDPQLSPKQLSPKDGAFSLAGAMQEAMRFASLHHSNLAAGGLKGLIQAEDEAKLVAAQEKERRRVATLKALLTSYVDWLIKQNRVSHRDTASIIRNHIFTPWPELSEQPACDIKAEQIADVLRLIVQKGFGRTSNKARAYIAAAYQLALRAPVDPTVPANFKQFGVVSNPASAIPANAALNKSDRNPLSAAELRAYWGVVDKIKGQKGGVLKLHLLSGGQRIEQLLRLKAEDVKQDHLVLWDIKGRPGREPRPIDLPLLPWIREALAEARCTCKNGFFVLSTDSGATHIANTTLNEWANQAAVEAGIEKFEPKRIRSGVETLLASKRVSEGLRGRLQSHGVTGIQARHYDAHDYLTEKAEALEVLYQALCQEPAVVIELRKRVGGFDL
ncbi:MAG: integrase family protein [Betaproteobacteria bacterium]|nr:integrase family protein [Betaproteobacteria bacterium]